MPRFYSSPLAISRISSSLKSSVNPQHSVLTPCKDQAPRLFIAGRHPNRLPVSDGIGTFRGRSALPLTPGGWVWELWGGAFLSKQAAMWKVWCVWGTFTPNAEAKPTPHSHFCPHFGIQSPHELASVSLSPCLLSTLHPPLTTNSWRRGRCTCFLCPDGCFPISLGSPLSSPGLARLSELLPCALMAPAVCFLHHHTRLTAASYPCAPVSKHRVKVKEKVAQSCPTLWDPTDYTVHEVLQVDILAWVAFPFSGGSSQEGLPNVGIEPRSPALWADSLPAEPQGKPKNTGVGSLSLLQRIFPTQESNQGLLHCRRILCQLSHDRSPNTV